MYNGTNFYNVGYWKEHTGTLGEACSSLVSRHLDLVKLNVLPHEILDAGCGLGTTTFMIGQQYPYARVTGINISTRQIGYAKEQYRDLRFEVMDAAALTFPDNSFDLIISIEAAFHFNTREKFLEQAFRVLRPGGQLIYSDLLFNDTSWVGNWSVPEPNLLPDKEMYSGMLNNSGFRIDYMEDITHDSWLGFCRHIRQLPGMETLANGLQQSVIAYLLVSLRK